MGLARRGVLFILSLLLLVSLIGLAFATSVYLALNKPATIENELAQSGFYSHFADNTIAGAKANSNSSFSATPIDFNNPQIQQAAHQALSPQFLKKQGNSFLDSNWAWLEGKQSKPTYTIDLTSAQQDFANRAGQVVSSRLAGLPACTRTQLAQLQSTSEINPFVITCLPPGVNPQAQGATITQAITQGSALVSNPTISPDSISPAQGQPYYQKFSKAPTFYQLSMKAPFFWGGLTLLLVLLIYWIARPKRRATRRIGVVVAIAGVLLLLNKLLEDALFNYVQKRAFNPANTSSTQKSLIDVAHRLEAQLVKIDIYFGLAFLAIAIILFVLLRRGAAATKSANAQPFQHPKPTPEPAAPTSDMNNFRAAQNTPPCQPTAPLLDHQNLKKPPRRKPPNLIQ